MPWYRHLLWPFAILYGLGVWFRNRLFDYRILPTRKFEVPVICIGNLETGGTGKSPMVNYVVDLLLRSDFKVAVLSRGYGRRTNGFVEVNSDSKSKEVGDEPLQCKRRFPNATVVVCENRVKGIETLLKLPFPPTVILMDDGFQHRWVTPSLSLLVTSASFSFNKNHLLPVGSLRESSAEAKRANAVIYTGIDNEAQLGTSEHGSMFETKTVSGKLVQFHGQNLDSDKINGCLLFSGIANPDRFRISAKEKLNVVGHTVFPDHHHFTVSDLESLRKKLDSFGTSANALVTTEKDAVRLIGSSVLNELEQIPMFYLPIETQFLGNQAERFDKMMLDHAKHA